MRTLLNITFLTSLLITSNVFAQQSVLDKKLKSKSTRVQKLAQKSINILSHHEKKEINKILGEAIVKMKQVIDGGMAPIPPAPSADFKCTWKDGQSDGISQRGHHLIEYVRGLQISKQFFGNGGTPSASKCLKTLIDITVHPGDISQAKRATCACKWMDGQGSTKPAKRGFHMTYKVPVQNGENLIEVNLSAQFFGNGGVVSQQKCQSKLVATNFSCRL